MEQIIEYIIRVTPALILIAGAFFLLKPQKQVRVVFYIFAFILFRDALTPSELWTLGITSGLPWIRLVPSHVFLIGMGLTSLTLVLLLIKFDKENSKEIIFFKTKIFRSIIIAIGSLFLLVLPFIIIYSYTDIAQRGGIVSNEFIVSILVFALLGNFLEELLFRGFLYNILTTKHKPIVAGVLSGLVFAMCHVFLATTVTSVGLPILLFILWEGIICGVIGSKYGIIPATIVHGGAIFFLTSGLI